MNIELDYALLAATERGNQHQAEELLKQGADPNVRDILSGYTALHHAAGRGQIDLVRMLVELGAKIGDRHNTVYESPLAWAVHSGQTEVVRYLLAKGADPEELLYPDDKPLVDEARDLGHEEIAVLLSQAVCINRK